MPRKTLIIKMRNLCPGNAMPVLRTINVRLKNKILFSGKTDKGNAIIELSHYELYLIKMDIISLL